MLKGKFFVITGPSTSGKTVISRELLKRLPSSTRLITVTTRLPRPNEKEGVDYFFVTKDEFQGRLDAGVFFESAEVYGQQYGSSKNIVEKLLEKFEFVFAVVDVQGAQTLKQKMPEAFVFFIKPGSFEDIVHRLHGERTDTPEDELLERLAKAKIEIEMGESFDVVINNVEGKFEETLREMLEIIKK